ncbi:uncharacterized protein EI90DRAFT_3120391 [Cantharellus anzutake]|uniref:uncharacterized protein n=1 Tax=Cantharellus anzutake TaxID=1750568 RepID=UPI001902DE9B|nr:uncharacterized protein EI90DRAFT_3120391 [Cantharellus anzutake]KAF8335348.1 hypothetical protein EI90DRAFT_3120391 [Cantharellus anzutake]
MSPHDIQIPVLPGFHMPGHARNTSGYRIPAPLPEDTPDDDPFISHVPFPAPIFPTRGRPKRHVTEEHPFPAKWTHKNKGVSGQAQQELQNCYSPCLSLGQEAQNMTPMEPLSPSKRLTNINPQTKSSPFSDVCGMWQTVQIDMANVLQSTTGKFDGGLRCAMCYSSAIQKINASTNLPKLGSLAIVELVLSILKSHGLTLGQFLVTMFGDPMGLSASARKSIWWFIGGRTKSAHPVDVVNAIYTHPWVRPNQSYEPKHVPLPEYALPLDYSLPETIPVEDENTYMELQSYFVARVIDWMEVEVKRLVKHPYLRTTDPTTTEFSWDTVLDFSASAVQQMSMEVSPVIWTMLTCIAVGDERATKLKDTKSQDSEIGLGSNHVCDPYLGCSIVLLMLIYFRNKNLNKFQSIMGILMFSENTEKSLQSIVSQVGLAVVYSSTLRRLYSMSTVASEKIRHIGSQWVDRLASFHVVYDNINQYHKNWRPSLASQTSLESGTAATLIMQPGVASDAFDGIEYELRQRCIKREDVTLSKVWNDINQEHLENTCVVNILCILLKHVPGLKRHERDFDKFRQAFAIHPTPLQKAEVIPLETSGFDEATTVGNRNTIRDIVGRQLGIAPEALDGRLIPFSGDQATISHLRTLKPHTSSGTTWFSSNRYILPLIEIWHMKFAMLKGIVKAHWPEQTEKGDIGLRFAADKLRRNLNPHKVDFYPMERLVEVILTAMTLNYFSFKDLCHIHTIPTSAPGSRNSELRLPEPYFPSITFSLPTPKRLSHLWLGHHLWSDSGTFRVRPQPRHLPDEYATPMSPTPDLRSGIPLASPSPEPPVLAPTSDFDPTSAYTHCIG